MKDKTHDHLREAFKKQPPLDAHIQNQVLETIQGQIKAKRTYRRPLTLVAAMMVSLVALGAMAYALHTYLSPGQVADQLGYDYIAQAFDHDQAHVLNQSLENDDFKVTLLGYLPGQALASYETFSPAPDQEDQSYLVVALERTDGQSMATTPQSFFITPLVEGINPLHYNTASLHGGYASTIQNGIDYRLVQMDAFEMFANRKIKLAVMSSDHYTVEAYTYDEETGQTLAKEDFTGLNLLFDLPMDASLADPQAGKDILDQLESSMPLDKQASDIDEGLGQDLHAKFVKLNYSDNQNYMQLLDTDGKLIGQKLSPSHEYIYASSHGWHPSANVNIAHILICQSDVYKASDQNFPDFLNPKVVASEIRVYDDDLDKPIVIAVDEAITGQVSYLTAQDYIDQVQLKTQASNDGQWMIISSRKACVLYNLQSKEMQTIDLDLDLVGGDHTAFCFGDDHTILIYSIDSQKATRDHRGTIDMDSLEVQWHE